MIFPRVFTADSAAVKVAVAEEDARKYAWTFSYHQLINMGQEMMSRAVNEEKCILLDLPQVSQGTRRSPVGNVTMKTDALTSQL